MYEAHLRPRYLFKVPICCYCSARIEKSKLGLESFKKKKTIKTLTAVQKSLEFPSMSQN